MMEGPTLAERLERLRSPNLESQKQTVIVLNAIESALREQNTEASATAYFAALLALLCQSVDEDPSRKNIDTSIVYLLDIVTPYTPHTLLRAKFALIMSCLAPIFTQPNSDAPLIRPSIGCLESLLLAQDSVTWELTASQISPRRAVASFLAMSVDPRPKVRKRALEALRRLLNSPLPGPTLDHPASAMCAEMAMASLNTLASRAKSNSRHNPKTMDDMRYPDLIHTLQLVQSIASSNSGWPSKKIEPLCELLVSIMHIGNDHMSVSVLEVFEIIFRGMTDDIISSKLHHLLEIIAELRPASNDTQLLPLWNAVLSRGYEVMSHVDPQETFRRLPDLFKLITPYLESPLGNIRLSTSECLVSFLDNCIPDQVILEPSIFDEKVLATLAGSASGLLGVRYQGAAKEVFEVLGAMFGTFRWRANPYLLDVTKTIGDLRSSETFAGKKDADKLIGLAIRAMGPATVLEVLPHNLMRPSPQNPGRAWLLPLFRDYTTNTKLDDFKTLFVPLSSVLYQKILDSGNAEKTTEIKVFETIVQQVWSILPGYCDLPLDLRSAFDSGFAKLLANLLYQQPSLRVDLCRGLKTLIESNQAAASLSEVEDHLFLQTRLSKAEALANLEHLRAFANQYLAVLFNVYGHTLPQSHGPILQAINAFLSITPAADLIQSFDEVCKLLADALKEEVNVNATRLQKLSTDAQVPSSHRLLDLVVTMASYLPRDSFATLFEIASLALAKDDDPQLQKKAYKLILRLAESEAGKFAIVERYDELQALMLASAEKVTASARRERLAALEALIPLIPDDALHFIPSILSEVVISCKEQNERARATAFDTLVAMGRRMVISQGFQIDNNKIPGMPVGSPAVRANVEEFFTMLSAGLAGSTPHTISASITAITRVLYEFHKLLDMQALDDIIQTMDLFLTSNNREIVRSVLGFVKVCVISLPVGMMRKRLPALVPTLLVWSHEHKSHFRAKVKHILDRMVRRFGFDAISSCCPEADHKLIANIRKTKQRNKRKKEAVDDTSTGNNSADEEIGGELLQNSKQFASGFDEALYSSSNDLTDGENDNIAKTRGNIESKRIQIHKKRSNWDDGTYIIEEEGQPLDLLDRKVIASVSSTRPLMLYQHSKEKVQFSEDGKLIFELNGDISTDKIRVDVDAEGDIRAESGVGAYMAALSSNDAPRRGFRGKLKWSNKKGPGDYEDEEEMMDADLDKSPGFRVERHIIKGSSGHTDRSRGFPGSGRVSYARPNLGVGKQRELLGKGGVGKSWLKKI